MKTEYKLEIFRNISEKALKFSEENYIKSDLKIDKDFILDNEIMDFIHITRNQGTHLFFLTPRNLLPDGTFKYLFGTTTARGFYNSQTEALEYFAAGSYGELLVLYCKNSFQLFPTIEYSLCHKTFVK
jgi:hypothetical protein